MESKISKWSAGIKDLNALLGRVEVNTQLALEAKKMPRYFNLVETAGLLEKVKENLLRDEAYDTEIPKLSGAEKERLERIRKQE